MFRIGSAPQTSSSGRIHGIYCAAIVFICVLVTRPYVQMGVDDDFSYILTAQKFAQTGHFFYNGWATAMLGWQVPIGALFLRIFGPSYTAPRMSTIFVALLTTYLVRRILQRCGVHGWNASIGTLLLMLTPIFFPLIPTFMSDVPGVFAIVVCLYACLRAIEAPGGKEALVWLSTAAASNLALGTARQISWLGVLVMVPSTAWLLRKWKGALPLGAALWLTGVLGILFFMHWFAMHPYSVPEHIVEGPIQRSMLMKARTLLVRSVATLALLSQPILLAFFFASAGEKKNRLSLIVSTVATTLAAGKLAVEAILKHEQAVNSDLFPWLGNLVSRFGTLAEYLMPGTPRTVLAQWFCICITLVTVMTSFYFLGMVFLNWHDVPGGVEADGHTSISAAKLNCLLLPFAVAYVALLAPRAIYGTIFDRYLIVPLLILTIYLLRYVELALAKQLSWIAPATVVLFTVFSIASTHDLFALNRARLAAAGELLQDGVTRSQIEGGFEYDGATQIDAWGYVNEPKIANPPGAFHTPRYDPCNYWFSRFTPALTPQYVLSFDSSCGVSYLPPVLYRAWLPPHLGKVYIQKVDPLPH